MEEEGKVIPFPRPRSDADWISKIPPAILAYVKTQRGKTFHVMYDARTGEFHGIVDAAMRQLHSLR